MVRRMGSSVTTAAIFSRADTMFSRDVVMNSDLILISSSWATRAGRVPDFHLPHIGHIAAASTGSRTIAGCPRHLGYSRLSSGDVGFLLPEVALAPISL